MKCQPAIKEPSLLRPPCLSKSSHARPPDRLPAGRRVIWGHSLSGWRQIAPVARQPATDKSTQTRPVGAPLQVGVMLVFLAPSVSIASRLASEKQTLAGWPASACQPQLANFGQPPQTSAGPIRRLAIVYHWHLTRSLSSASGELYKLTRRVRCQ